MQVAVLVFTVRDIIPRAWFHRLSLASVMCPIAHMEPDDVYSIRHNFVRVHFITKQIPAVALGIIEQGLSFRNLHPMRLEFNRTSAEKKSSKYSHASCEKCHSLFCGYRLAFQQDGVTIQLSRHSWSGRTHSGQIINSTSNEGDDHESQDQCKSGPCRLLLLPRDQWLWRLGFKQQKRSAAERPPSSSTRSDQRP